MALALSKDSAPIGLIPCSVQSRAASRERCVVQEDHRCWYAMRKCRRGCVPDAPGGEVILGVGVENMWRKLVPAGAQLRWDRSVEKESSQGLLR